MNETLIIGRQTPADLIPCGSGIESLSRRHARVSTSPNRQGYYQLEDLQSTNGTFIFRNGGWQRITRAEVTDQEVLRFGNYTTTLSELMCVTRMVPQERTRPVEPESGEWIRNPLTGEIIYSNDIRRL
ncbi:MAG: FHA domain-containing protein [Akkermansia sp.]|nr:FHA domain-containing protein [Akkermansia sp.]